jgi:hypothetical protein
MSSSGKSFGNDLTKEYFESTGGIFFQQALAATHGYKIDAERRKFHDKAWLLSQNDGGYYCEFEWDTCTSIGSMCIFRKGGLPGVTGVSHDMLIMYDPSLKAGLHKAQSTDFFWPGENERHRAAEIKSDKPGVFSRASPEQIVFYKNVVHAFQEAYQGIPYCEGVPYECEHVAGHDKAQAAQKVMFFKPNGELGRFDLEETFYNWTFDQPPVFYSCRANNRTRHIFDGGPHDCIKFSPTNEEYCGHYDVATDLHHTDLVRVATAEERRWLERCREAQRIVAR